MTTLFEKIKTSKIVPLSNSLSYATTITLKGDDEEDEYLDNNQPKPSLSPSSSSSFSSSDLWDCLHPFRWRIYYNNNDDFDVGSSLANEKVDYLGRFRDSPLQQEYISYCLKRKSFLLVFLITVMITVWSLGETLASSYYSNNQVISCRFAVFDCLMLGVVWLCFYFMFFFSSCGCNNKKESGRCNHHNSVPNTTNNTPPGSPQQQHSPGIGNTATADFESTVSSSTRATNDSSSQLAFVLCINFLLTLKFLKQIATGTIHCVPLDVVRDYEKQVGTQIVSDDLFICPEKSSFLSLVSTNLVPIMAICTFLLMAILFEPRLYLVVFCILVNGGLILASQANCVYEFLPNLIPIIILLVLFYDLHRQRMQLFLNRKSLKELLKENERNAEAMHALEMRSMIGNVAHDLKTVRSLSSPLCPGLSFFVFSFFSLVSFPLFAQPLSSFTNGLDVINDIVVTTSTKLDTLSLNSNDKEATSLAIKDSFSSIQQCLSTIRNTNAFMLMTINRCLDYTKASKGMMLVPKLETVDLVETLRFPIECMIGVQEKIPISLNIPPDICNYLITDKQWLQENILCLLSNAVKYSTEGEVVVTARITTEKPISHTTNPVAPLPNGIEEISLRRTGDNSTSRRKPSNGGEKLQDYPLSLQLASITTKTEKLSYVKFEIEDHGIGLTTDIMKTLFNPFKQAQRLAGGTGLGLFSLAKRMEALKGSYGVSHRSDGKKGSCFWFAFPYRPDYNYDQLHHPIHHRLQKSQKQHSSSSASASSDSSLNCSSVGEEKGGGDGEHQDLALSIPILNEGSGINLTNLRKSVSLSPKPMSTLSTKPLEILIVDDVPSIVKMLTMMFKRQGHLISSAENGEIALNLIEKKWKTSSKGYDVILMDLQMPVMDGYEATKRLRKLEEDQVDWMKTLIPSSSVSSGSLSPPVTPNKLLEEPLQKHHQLIIGVSANSDYETMKSALNAGIDDFIAKPFSFELFSRTLQKYLH
jgi:signal transduction histidine kinase/CheY-like chemotaxis protein